MNRMIAALFLTIAIAAPTLGSAQSQSRPALSDMSEIEREALRTEIRAYLLEHPEVLMEAIQILEARRTVDRDQADAALIAENRGALYDDPNSWVGGNPDGDVTLVEFSDYRCGYCKRAHPELQQLLERDPNLRMVVKEFPILGPDSIAAARMAQAALDVDRARYGALNDALMSFDGQLTEAIAYQIAGQVGYDIAALKARAASAEIEARIADNHALARKLGLEGTPSFVIGNRILRGYLPLDRMIQAVAEARAATN